MQVLISSVGTRGDVQPAVALALELRKLGHELRLCVPPNFIKWVGDLGFEALPMGVEMRAPRPGTTPRTPPVLPDLIRDQFDTIEAAANGCNLIVGCGVHQYAVRSIAELHGIPCVVAAYAPVSLPCLNLTPPGIAEQPRDDETNLRLWKEAKQSWNNRSLDRVNTNRARLNLGAVEDVLDHILADHPWLAADRTLAPLPSTQSANVFQTGAWILPDSDALPPELETFLNEGEPPVYLGFGSMPVVESINRTLIDAVRAVGMRVILSRGWAELELIDEGQDCISIGDINQQLLFPRVAAVVHHGGAGTTVAAGRAGAPQITVPQFGDQFYWGRRIRNLGMGAAVPFSDLTVESLILALRYVLEPSVLERARSVSKSVDANGAAIAAQRLAESMPFVA